MIRENLIESFYCNYNKIFLYMLQLNIANQSLFLKVVNYKISSRSINKISKIVSTVHKEKIKVYVGGRIPT